MDRILSAAPRPELRPFVRAYAQRQVTGSGVDLQPIPASLEQVLEFEFGDPLLVEYRDGTTHSMSHAYIVGGHNSCHASLRFRGYVESFAVFFQPFGLWQLFGLPPGEIHDRAFSASDVLGPAFSRLWLQMAEAPSFAHRVALVETALCRRAEAAFAQTPILDAAMHIFEHHGVHRIGAVAQSSGLSLRQFQRRFRAEAGLHPKLFSRISRFQMALDSKVRQPQLSWLSIAHQFGYHDQAHMLLDFQDLGGSAPGSLLAHLGDGRPDALAASQS